MKALFLNCLERSSIVILSIYSWCANIMVFFFFYKCFDSTFCGDKKYRFSCGYNFTPLKLYFSKQWLIKNAADISLKILQMLQKSFNFLLFQINENVEKSTKSNAYFKIKEHWWLLRIPPYPWYLRATKFLIEHIIF